ncbi:choice-of-anchor A family protein [Streptomyces sp. BI20]|uniref:choice-of-anchor A family protein n=1 Tax=Streptomyces sp. BI20 TaxID=3403460 RepID=UPI003C73AC73
MSIPVRTAFALTAALGGSLALGAIAAPAALATPAPTSCVSPLGIANGYGEFIEKDLKHTPDAEGAVAVGGNADFTGGFSVANELSPAQVTALPGGNTLVVGGDVKGTVQLMKGNAVYGGTLSGTIDPHDKTAKVVKGPSPIDFTAEFAKLRAASTALAGAQSAGASWKLTGNVLEFTGTDATRNDFVVPAAELAKAKEVRVKVPTGAVTVVSVTGTTYDQAKAGTYGFFLYDNATGKYVNDDKLASAADGKIRAKLLWNFPEATSIVKNSPNAWPGSILAPKADFRLGSGGPVNGSVIARSLVGSGGAETHHYPFAGCLPEKPGKPSDKPSDKPSPSTSSPAPSTTPSGSASATPSASTTPSVTPSGSASTPGTAPSPSASTPGGDLANTGAGMTGPIAIGGAVVLAVGAGMVVVARRRRA